MYVNLVLCRSFFHTFGPFYDVYMSQDGRYEDFRKGNFARLGPNEAGAQAE